VVASRIISASSPIAVGKNLESYLMFIRENARMHEEYSGEMLPCAPDAVQLILALPPSHSGYNLTTMYWKNHVAKGGMREHLA
jgi:hypothetical protein